MFRDRPFSRRLSGRLFCYQQAWVMLAGDLVRWPFDEAWNSGPRGILATTFTILARPGLALAA
jgi:hypothetical protein